MGDLSDVSVVCSAKEPSACSLLVLYDHGSELTECHLFWASDNRTYNAMRGSLGKVTAHAPWKLASAWLHTEGEKQPEQMKSVAVNSECYKQKKGARALRIGSPGCAFIGTSKGRVVQLKMG